MLAFRFILSAFVFCFSGFVLADIGVYNNFDLYQYGPWGAAPAQRYLSDHDVWGTLFNVPIWNRSALSIEKTPHLLMSFIYDGKMGPNIFDSSDLSLVYANLSFPFVNNLRVQQYKGEKILTFWTGKQGKHHAQGHCIALNKHYEIIWNITSSANFDSGADLHECEVTHDNTVLVTIYEPTPEFDLTSVGGSWNDTLLDSCFEEIDPETGSAVFTWRASTHIHPTASYHKYPDGNEDGWDAYHINSLQKTKEGNYIVDLRRARAITLIDGQVGWPIWTLGGKANNFEDLSGGAATAFAWQHHARFLDDDLTQLTMFDNRALEWDHSLGGPQELGSRGLKLRVQHYPHRTVEVVQEFFADASLGAYAMGSFDTLPNGNALIGWGSQAGFSEYTADGKCVMDVQYGRYNTYVRTYRVYKDTWVGMPKWNPKLAIDLPGNTVHVSWNGATEAKSWTIVFAQEQQTLASFEAVDGDKIFSVHAKKKGFETAISVDDALQNFKLLRVAALDIDGNVLGASDIFSTADGRSWTVEEPTENMFFNQKSNAIVSPYSQSTRSQYHRHGEVHGEVHGHQHHHHHHHHNP